MGITEAVPRPLREARRWPVRRVETGRVLRLRFRRKRQRDGIRRGLWVVLLGPDGAGKSSVIAALGSGASAGFAGCETFHLRPPLPGQAERAKANTDPHGQAARGTLLTIGKLVYLLAANWLGYLMVVQPRVARGMLVLFDRYFPDCVVDAKRYRMPRSCRRLVEVVARLVPQPDLCVVLDASPVILRGRKREVSAAELFRQCNAYTMLGEKFSNVTVVDAGRSLPEVVNDVVDCIIERHLAGGSIRVHAA
jgi:thymidylate kinase